jgi:hypothetical protein
LGCALRRAGEGEAAVAYELRRAFTPLFEAACDRVMRALVRPLAKLAASAEPTAVMGEFRRTAESRRQFFDSLLDPLLSLYGDVLLLFGLGPVQVGLGQGRRWLAAIEADLQGAADGGAAKLAARLSDLLETGRNQLAREMLSSVKGRNES